MIEIMEQTVGVTGEAVKRASVIAGAGFRPGEVTAEKAAIFSRIGQGGLFWPVTFPVEVIGIL